MENYTLCDVTDMIDLPTGKALTIAGGIKMKTPVESDDSDDTSM